LKIITPNMFIFRRQGENISIFVLISGDFDERAVEIESVEELEDEIIVSSI
jgi:hypothetical protein